MDTKPAIKPAAPLPYRCDSHPEEDFAEILSSNDGPVARTTHDDAAYIVHACNAYPKLVEALRVAADQIAYLQEISGNDKHGPLDALRDARALLRELGEG